MGWRARLGASTLLALALAGAGAGCAGSPAATPDPAAAVDPTYEPAFQALRAALEAHDDALAQRILARILARGPEGPTLEHAEAYGRILRGRALSAGLQLALEASEAPDGEGVALTLLARQPLETPLVLRSGPGTLRLLLTGLDGAGTEQRVARSLALSEVAELRIAPGVQARVPLGTYSVPTAGALAVLAEWDLRLQPGTLDVGEGDLPAKAVAVQGCETRRLASWLPQEPVDPAELARYVQAGGRSMPALVERAVRVDLARREEALDALAPVVVGLPKVDLPVLVPVLRWLSGRRDMGADPDAWVAWLEARAAPPTQPDGLPAIDLPETAKPPVVRVPPSGGGRP